MSADAEFKQFIDRILHCREAEDAAKADTKEVYAELKGLGYDKTAAGALVSELRKREKDPDQFAERETVLDLYRDAYQRASGTKRAIAHTHEISPSTGRASPTARNPETGSGSANTENDDVDRSAERAVSYSDIISGNVSLAARESEKPLHSNSLSHPSPLPSPPTDESPAPDPNPAPGSPSNPDCQNPKSCRWSHSQASCAKCATDAAIARQRGRAA